MQIFLYHIREAVVKGTLGEYLAQERDINAFVDANTTPPEPNPRPLLHLIIKTQLGSQRWY